MLQQHMIKKLSAVAGVLVALLGLPLSAAAAEAEELGIFEKILNASGDFSETTTAFEAALANSGLTLHAKHDIRVPDGVQESRVYVLTSPAYLEAARNEAPNTISAQIQRVAIYTYGEGKKTYINMANPVAHAMIYYSDSDNYKTLLQAAEKVADSIRQVAASVPGTPVTEQLEPIRKAKAYRKFNGDGPAKMMAKFRNWEKSQLEIIDGQSGDVNTVAAKIEKALASSKQGDAEDASGWQIVSKIPVGDNAVYFGITNQYTENKIIRINSDFRKDGKAEDAPYPGVDHSTALPLEVLVFKDGNDVKVVQYGEMWRMQLYFWDSGYLAFAKNTLIPAKIVGSIEDAIDL